MPLWWRKLRCWSGFFGGGGWRVLTSGTPQCSVTERFFSFWFSSLEEWGHLPGSATEKTRDKGCLVCVGVCARVSVGVWCLCLCCVCVCRPIFSMWIFRSAPPLNNVLDLRLKRLKTMDKGCLVCVCVVCVWVCACVRVCVCVCRPMWIFRSGLHLTKIQDMRL